MATLHAHVNTESRDCDGRYSRSHVVTPGAGEDDWDFRSSVIGNALAYADGTRVEFDKGGFTMHADTEEGYISTDVTWCERDDTDTRSTFRDQSAEAAGY